MNDASRDVAPRNGSASPHSNASGAAVREDSARLDDSLPYSAESPAFAFFQDNNAKTTLSMAYRKDRSNDTYYVGGTPNTFAGGIDTNNPAPVSYQGNVFGIQNAPALAVFQGKLYLAHRGTRWGSYTGNEIWYTAFDGTGWSPDTPVSYGNGYANTTASPALAVFNDKLYLIFRGTEGSGYIWYSTFDGNTWSEGVTIADPFGNYAYTSDAPAAAVFNNRLYVAHRGTAWAKYTGEEIWYTRYDGAQWSSDIPITNPQGRFLYTPNQPALAANEGNGNLYLAYRGTAFGSYTGRELWNTSFDGSIWAKEVTWPNNRPDVPVQLTMNGPALTYIPPLGQVWWSVRGLDSALIGQDLLATL